jgi:hypothetical protein
MNITDENIAQYYNLFKLSGNELFPRLFAGFVATVLGYGGILPGLLLPLVCPPKP